MLDHSVDTGTRPLSKEGDAARVSSKETEDEAKEECVIYFLFAHRQHVQLQLQLLTLFSRASQLERFNTPLPFNVQLLSQTTS
jgi:hypothetical protein